ncbi:MAG: phosphoribosylamine--glycine ligase [Chitinispirillaceae bacterium]|nr:phosphoribosylamine--glycine ligase [Chitinispirillaceae bacterium]
MDLINSVLIIGSGGREHAILKAFLRSDRALSMYAYPGNPGMEKDGCFLVDKEIKNWVDLARWAVANKIELTVVGPEAPLVDGIVNIFREHGLTIFGPTREAAIIEGSKAFAKNLMKKYHIPTAPFCEFTNRNSAVEYINKKGAPIVVKVSGLAAGKGAIVCNTKEEAFNALNDIFDKKIFGDAGSTVIIEEKMEGEEISVFVLTDGESYKILPISQDHKRVGDGDTGPNTGGMGAYAPVPEIDNTLHKRIEDEIVKPTLKAMREEGRKYQGLLYCGLMLTKEGPKVVEYNCRFGDPETEAVLPLVKCDWFELFSSIAKGKMANIPVEISKEYCTTVILAAEGYPGKYNRGMVIEGIDKVENSYSNIDIYHCGTAIDSSGRIITNGGRVLAISGRGTTLKEAINISYKGVKLINFEGKYFRKDIAYKGLTKLKES